MGKKVRQTITMDVERLKTTFIWHLNIGKKLKKFEQINKIDDFEDQEILQLIKECRVELLDMNTTLLEFEEIYEALTGEDPPTDPVVPPDEVESPEELEKEINNRFIGNLLSGIDSGLEE